jgi:predicted PurR-regulated permease PerM
VRAAGREPAIATIARIVLVVVAVVVVLYVIWLLRRPLSWVFIAGFLAIALSGPVNLLDRWMPRRLAIAVTYLALILIPALLLAILIPPIVTEASGLADKAPEYAADVQSFVNDNQTLRDLEDKYGVITKLQDEAQKLPNRIGDAAGALGDVGVGLVNSIFALVTILILSIFLVSSGPGWIRRLIDLQPVEHRARMQSAFTRIGQAVVSYVAGALFQAVVAGLTTFVVLTLLGVPFAAPLAVVTALLDLIPLVGATIGAVIVGVVTVFQDFPTVTIIWTIWAIIYQQIENSVIQPQIQRRAVNVHAFVVLTAVLFGSTLFGILGALLAIPVAADPSDRAARDPRLPARDPGAHDDGEQHRPGGGDGDARSAAALDDLPESGRTGASTCETPLLSTKAASSRRCRLLRRASRACATASPASPSARGCPTACAARWRSRSARHAPTRSCTPTAGARPTAARRSRSARSAATAACA